jgi:hypothetical protein
MAEPHSCPELADLLHQSTPKVYYHVKAMEKAGLVERVGERKVKAILEGVYQARARSYWLSPQLVSRLGGKRRAQDELSLSYLLNLAEELQSDIGHLAQAANEQVPSLGSSAEIYLPDGQRRAAFLAEVQQTFQNLARKYGLPEGEAATSTAGQGFRLMLACYPQPASPKGISQ